MKPDVSTLLIHLIDAAERAICCRQPIPHDMLIELEPQIATLQSPVGAPLSPAPDLLMRALLEVSRTRGGASAWLMIAGCLLPVVRDDLSRVIEARKQPAATDAELPYWHK